MKNTSGYISRDKLAFYFLLSLSLTTHSIAAQTSDATTPASWPSSGQNTSNTRQQPQETILNPTNVSKLQPKWVFTTGAEVSATPTVSNNVVYAPDWAGNLSAINATTGQQIWQHKVSEYDGIAGVNSRSSPLVLSDEVVIGDNLNATTLHAGANVIAVDPATGKLKWITRVDTHPTAAITGSAVAYNNIIYVGVSSNEERFVTVPGYPCCTFRGSVVALDAESGKMLWQTYTIPANGGSTNEFSGGTIWQTPAIDPGRGLLYIGTGNNFTVPPGNADCEIKNTQNHNSGSCTPPDDHIDSALALDLKTGTIKWATKMLDYDTWNIDCAVTPAPGATPCPVPAGPDFDMGGSGPNFLGNIVGFAQKSGIYRALDPDTGKILWSTSVGPGGAEGGIQWGTATDGSSIYVPIGNSSKIPYTLAPSGQTISWGSWSALDVTTGKILWQTPDPKENFDLSAASIANGVVYAASMSGMMYALDAKSGKILWSFDSGGSVVDGPSIVNGTVYWGSGYTRSQTIIPSIGNNKIYAFSLPK